MEVLNITFTYETKKMDNSTAFFVAKVVCMSLWAVLVLVPNCFVLVVLMWKSNLRKNHRTEFIMWLSVSDIIVGITSVLYLLTNLVHSLATSPVFCCLTLHFVYSGILLSLLHTFWLCYERYLAVVRKVKFRLLRKKMKYILIIGSWVTVNLYIAIIAACFLRVDTIEYCGIEAFPNGKYFMLSGSIVNLPILILTISICIRFSVQLRRHLRRINASTNQPAIISISVRDVGDTDSRVPSTSTDRVQQTFRINERDITITIGSIAIALFFLTGPFVVTKFIEGLSLVTLSRFVKICISFLAGSNAIFNPIFYAWRLKAFRREIRNIFSRHN